MRTRAPLISAMVGAAWLAIGPGCGPPRAEATLDAAAATVRLFEVAREGDSATRRVDEWFAKPPTGAAAASLHDLLDELARVVDPRVVGIEPIEGDDRVAVDVEGAPASGGTARYSLHLARGDGRWKVEWIGGPGLVWPARPGGSRGPGLTSSHGENASGPG